MKFAMRCPMRAALLFFSLAAMVLPASATRMLSANSLQTCQKNSGFSAAHFDVVYTPDNSSVAINMVATSSIHGKVVFDVFASAYGFKLLQKTFDPCDPSLGFTYLCPMRAGKLPITFSPTVSDSAVSGQAYNIAYGIPDLDTTIRVNFNTTDTHESVACVEFNLSNGQTVDQLGVKWATAIITCLMLVASAVISSQGYTNTAAHITAASLSLFAYFQSQAIIGLTAVNLTPIGQAWTQNFQWSMGVIHLGWMQNVFTWFQRATGGTASTILDSLDTVSVQVEKRDLTGMASCSLKHFKRGLGAMTRGIEVTKRGDVSNYSGSYVVYGIQRVAFRANIESTNVFMTSLTFFCIFVTFTILGVAGLKAICELCVKRNMIANDKFLQLRNSWSVKNIFFRAMLLGFPQMVIFCLWEFTQVDSPAEVTLAVFFFFGTLGSLVWGAIKVIAIANRSITMYQSPAHGLFSDHQVLDKWSCLYIQYRASAYYFFCPLLAYIFLKGIFVALAQKNSVAQAIGFVVIEAGALIGASVFRPWMDKRTNSFNISICVVNFLNAIFLLILSDVFGVPQSVTGITGIVFVLVNAIFSLVLLIMIIVSITVTFFRKNPDAYHQFADDRASFMKSRTDLNTTTELDALAATARGDRSDYKSQLDLGGDVASFPSEPMRTRAEQSVSLSMPLLSAGHQRPESPFRSPELRADSLSRSPSPSPHSHMDSAAVQNRTQNSTSPWQRGAGYDH